MYKKLAELKENSFLLKELVKRDFKKKYKGTLLGMLWSVMSPLMMLFVMSVIFTNFFGRRTPQYTIYIFCGNIIFSYFSDCTIGSMSSLLENAPIFSKIKVPKYLFLLSKSLSSLINFGLTLAVFFLFCVIDGISFSPSFLLLFFPVVCLTVFNIGVGLLLSALYFFFRDIQYLWGIFIQLLMYLSAIFYTVDSFSPAAQNLFWANPIYVFITYFRSIVIYGEIPSTSLHLLAALYALLWFLVGGIAYRRLNRKFLYYL